MLTVISPAKTLDFDTPPTTQEHSQPRFLSQSQELIDTLRQMSTADIASLMKLSDKLAGLNVARYETWQTPFNLDNAKQAVLAFQGDVYTGLDAETLNEKQLTFAQKHLRILSGLYGVLKPLDLIQPYRLEMGTKLDNAKGKDLYAFWGSDIRQSLQAEDAMQDEVLINLASNEYFKAVEAKKLKARIITPVFKDWKNGQYKMISFYAKKARGMMSRYIIEHELQDPDRIKDFDTDGYRFSADMSKKDEWVFIRHQE
ncbi:MAG: peroxide stress protein YaaA [Methylophaga sp.]|uniref:peroxide stress protein YaaA n=1 Tax=Methylophaga sp. UBA678 TaxID=1946901 RepID=UPI000C5C8FD9|nr:peroxide stress protein YaaA [Methylophaga sp. UBA678]MAX52667.1 peroxide stress protein YaaA [Methylophaga sp.]|tara:strand:+ start:5494 stop:6264 length:771 start_codon:yes stop_codon:yes gene_type:complete